MKKIILFLFTLCFILKTSAQNKDEMFIRNAMNEQLNAWNGGNLEKFMDTYWHSDSLIFIGKNGQTYGWDNTLLNYKKSYPDTAAMGKLDFTIISIKRLSVLYFSSAALHSDGLA